MSNWINLEKDCCEYLNSKYGTEAISFEMTGGSDSNTPDIKVYIGGKNTFNMEVKSANAQSGQFVVMQRDGHFVFSNKNKSNEGDAVPFLSHMNANFEKYKDVTTQGVALDMSEEEYTSWITIHYKAKNTKFVITKSEQSFVVFPIEKYGSYFDISCVYRIKKSGSQDISKAQVTEIAKHFSFDSGFFIRRQGKKSFVKTTEVLKLKEKFFVGENEYMVSEIINGEYYIRKLSATKNANVIFSIKLKKEQDLADLTQFEQSLR